MIARLPIRLRLSLLYGGIVFVVGAALMTVAYAIVDQNLSVYSHRVASARPSARPPLSIPLPPRRHGLADLEAFLRRQNRRAAAVEHRARIDAQDSVAIEFLAALVGLTLPSAALGYVLAGRALRPVRAITETAERVAEGDLSRRIALSGPHDELRGLADTFDAMLQRLEDAFARQEAFVANASHELRTPLAIVRAELDATLADPSAGEVELRAMGEAISSATARSEQLLERLLLLARSERAMLSLEPVDLRRVAEGVIGDLAAEADVRSIQVSWSLGEAVAWGDEVLLTALVQNLVENAIRHNTCAGTVEIVTTGGGKVSLLEVRNDGPVVPEALAEKLVEPFQRLGRASGPSAGSGLGLAIARAVVVAHGGRLRVESRAGGGLCVFAALPARARESLNGEAGTPLPALRDAGSLDAGP